MLAQHSGSSVCDAAIDRSVGRSVGRSHLTNKSPPPTTTTRPPPPPAGVCAGRREVAQASLIFLSAAFHVSDPTIVAAREDAAQRPGGSAAPDKDPRGLEVMFGLLGGGGGGVGGGGGASFSAV